MRGVGGCTGSASATLPGRTFSVASTWDHFQVWVGPHNGHARQPFTHRPPPLRGGPNRRVRWGHGTHPKRPLPGVCSQPNRDRWQSPANPMKAHIAQHTESQIWHLRAHQCSPSMVLGPWWGCLTGNTLFFLHPGIGPGVRNRSKIGPKNRSIFSIFGNYEKPGRLAWEWCLGGGICQRERLKTGWFANCGPWHARSKNRAPPKIPLAQGQHSPHHTYELASAAQA